MLRNMNCLNQSRNKKMDIAQHWNGKTSRKKHPPQLKISPISATLHKSRPLRITKNTIQQNNTQCSKNVISRPKHSYNSTRRSVVLNRTSTIKEVECNSNSTYVTADVVCKGRHARRGFVNIREGEGR